MGGYRQDRRPVVIGEDQGTVRNGGVPGQRMIADK
jgi:hypothetical protein